MPPRWWGAALAALWITLAALAPLTAALTQPGEPPRVDAHTMFEYRHLQVFNKDYLKWTSENIKAIQYEALPGAYLSRWDAVLEAVGSGRPEVVMVTQSTVSRLQSLQLVAREWAGPITVTIYIELPAGEPGAEACRERVTAWLRENVVEAWPEGSSPPLAVSFLHANAAAGDADCDLPAPMESGEPRATKRGQARRHQATDADDGTLWQPKLPQYLEHRFDNAGAARRLRAAADRKPIWHPRGFVQPEPPHGSRSWRKTYDSFYPVNTLRNVAWSQVPQGAFVFLNDADFLPSKRMYEDLTTGLWAPELGRMRDAYNTEGRRITFVAPAFERLAAAGPGGGRGRKRPVPFRGECTSATGCEVLQGMALPRTFKSLRSMMQVAAVDVFHRPQFPVGHNCYSWLSWFQEEAPEELVEMEYSHPCEPYVIALSDALPRYDERFRGRSQNKVQQLTHMAMWGFEWRLLPAHFVLHIPHSSTAAQPGGWDVATQPLALMKVLMREIEAQPEFKRHVQQDVPIPLAK